MATCITLLVLLLSCGEWSSSERFSNTLTRNNTALTAHSSRFRNLIASDESATKEKSISNSSSIGDTIGNSTSSTRICQSIDVRNKVSNLLLLRGCRVVEGSVQVVLIDHANETDYDNFSFPELREITHYLLFYRVSGLRSVSQLFPSLSVIRGNAVFEDYALVIYEMFHLHEVGLINLAEITRGAVRIEKNPSLCFLSTINWDLIARWDSVKNYISQNKSPADCPGSSVCQEAGCPLELCWTSTDCQIQGNGTYKSCHDQCIGGCSGPGPKACHSCRKYLTVDGECVSSCPNETYLHMNRRCVTKDHCLSLIDQKEESEILKFVVFNGTCIQNCPPGYDFTEDKKGCEKCEKGKCRKVCAGISIDNIAAAQTLRGCTFINGSLEIAIKHGKHKILAEELRESLQSIEEIVGYLKVIRCFPLVNLKFFKNLETIYGEDPLDNGKYALVILDNQNLQELWELTSSFKILKGRMFFHYNPKLCFFHIESLIKITGLQNISSFEVAQNSNGDKFACNMTKVEVNFPLVTSNSVLINIILPNQTSPYPSLQRYVLYYTEATSINMTALEEMDECDDDSWRVRDVLIESDQQVFTLQTFLKPFTQYAFYVKTYTVHSIGGQSPIHYIRTLPSRPSDITLTLSYSNTSSSIVLQWEPPRHPNGILAYYIVTGFWQKDDRAVLDQRDYCLYPLMEEAIEQLAPDFLTAVENETSTCCPKNKITYKPKGEYGRLCDNSRLGQLYIERNEEDISITCNKYFYSFVYENPLAITGPKSKEEENNTKTIHYKKINDYSQNQYINKVDIKEPPDKNTLRNSIKKYETFNEIAPSETTTFMVNNLHHFAKYTVSVRACRKAYTEQEEENDKRCSKSEIVTIRTLRNPKADDILSNTVTHVLIEEENKIVVEIRWRIPQHPNGIVVAFEIEHSRRDLENAKPTVECLSYIDYTKNGRKFALQGLPPGKYTYRLRAISLAGPGLYTRHFQFDIEQINSKYYHKLFVLIIAAFTTATISVGYYALYQRRRYALDLDSLLASANTEHYTSPPYIEDSWEIPRENIKILRDLGQGSFGKVYEGILLPVKLPCAVKTITNPNIIHSSAFLNETNVMKRAAGIHHMVQLLGVVSRGEPPLVVMELLSLGDLKSYLRSAKELPPRDSVFLLMAAQIADAMFFMEANTFVHCDLAARNCMLHKDLTVKVGDFGLTRNIYSTDYYRKGDKGLLPIRWMAPESLRDGVFTSQSDMWSYGVVLWEIATLAEQPHGGLTNEQVLRRVVAGETLTMPVFCPEQIKTIMALCWKRNPASRPSFQHVVSRLEIYTNDVFRCVSYYHTVTSNEIDDNADHSSQYHQPRITFY